MSKDLIDDQYGRFWELPKYLAKNNCDVKGICLSYRPKKSGIVYSNCVVWESINLGLFKFFGFFKFLLSAYKESRNADVIIAFSDSIYGIIGYLIAKVQSKPFIFDLYDNFEYYFFAKLPILKQLYKWVARKSDIVICVSRPLYKLVKTYGRRKETYIIENAIPENTFFKMNKTSCRKHFNLPEQADLIGTVGALHTNRNIHVLFAAFNQLKEMNPDLHLVVAGPRNIQIPRDQRIHDLGILSYRDVPMLLNTLDIAVVCNKNSNFGNYCFPQKTREIMACEVPILAADIGAMREFLAQYPECLFAHNDSNDLAEKIQQMLKRGVSYNKIGIPNWKETAQQLIKILNQLIRPGAYKPL